MSRRIARYPFSDVVLIADQRPNVTSDLAPHLRHDLEMADEDMVAQVTDALGDLGLKWHRYYNPADLALAAEKHRNDVVLSLYGGERSRNRIAMPAAACELTGLKCVGADTYSNVMCQDKVVSKYFAQECGLLTPWHRLIRTGRDCRSLASLAPPYVIKPKMEGTSIGISQRSLIRDANDGPAVAKELLDVFGPWLMVEEFIPGREVSISLIEGSPDRRAYAEIFVHGQGEYFDDHLFDAEEKISRRLDRSVRNLDGMLAPVDRSAVDRLVDVLGPLGYCRVDGKHHEGRFHFIEITPDPWIGPTGAFSASFTNQGLPYREVIEAVLLSAYPTLPGR
jgi:D-alanine-D-alanine ligase